MTAHGDVREREGTMRRGEITHRRVTWKVSTHRRFQETACRSEEGKRTSFPSGVTCGECQEKTPGFQALGMLERAMELLEDLAPEHIPVPEEALEKLREAREMIGAQKPEVCRVPPKQETGA